MPVDQDASSRSIKQLDLAANAGNLFYLLYFAVASIAPLDLNLDLYSACPRSHAINARDETDKPAKSDTSKARANSKASSTTK